MRVVIIGAGGHGKSTLAEAIKILTNTECEVMNTKDLMQVKAEKLKTMEEKLNEIGIGEIEELKPIAISDNTNHRKKGKEVKNWQRTKFYQR